VKYIGFGPRDRKGKAGKHAYDAGRRLQQMVDKFAGRKTDYFWSAPVQAVEVELVMGSRLDQIASEQSLPYNRTTGIASGERNQQADLHRGRVSLRIACVCDFNVLP
jgi:hypothetical protein